jgi:PAS domain S-box-containing protein
MPSQTTPFESVLEAMPDALVGVDKEGIIRFVNHQTELLFGYDRDDLVGRPIETLVPESMRQLHRTHRMNAEDHGTRAMGLDLGLKGRGRDGTEFPADISLSNIDTDDGPLVIAAVRDMTERKKAEEAQKRLYWNAAVTESSFDAILSVGLDGNMTGWNVAAKRMFGYLDDEIIGKTIWLLFPDTEAEESRLIVARVVAGLPTENLEALRVRKDGTSFPASITVSAIHDAAGAIIGASTIVRDVTKERQAFEAARSMIESSLDSLVTISPEGMITDVNEATVKVTGIPREELVGTAFSDYFTEPEKANEIYQRVFAEGMAVDYPLTMRHRDGTLTDVLYNAAVQRDADGNVLGVFAAARDVTEQRQAFEAARSMIESSLDSLVTISPEGMITDVNGATVKVTGVPREKLIGTAFSDYFTEPEKANEIYQRVFAEGMTVDYPLTMRHRDGRLTDVLYNASVQRDASGEVLGVFAAARDVTEQRQAQYARSLIEAGLDPLVTISAEGKITDVNEATVKVTGIPREELIETDFSDYFTEPDKANEGYQRAFAEGSVTDYPLTMRHRGGALTDVLYNASVYRDAAGSVLGVFAAARDVTEQKRAGLYARSLLEAALDPLVTISAEGKITDVNEATVKVTGVPREELIGTDFSDYFTEPDKANEGYQRAFAEGSVTDYPLTMRNRGGALTDVLYNASVYRDAAGSVLGVFAAARDVTEQKQAQAAIAQQAKELDRLAELERFQRLTVGRELKMIELKKEIEHLRRLVDVDGGRPDGPL